MPDYIPNNFYEDNYFQLEDIPESYSVTGHEASKWNSSQNPQTHPKEDTAALLNIHDELSQSPGIVLFDEKIQNATIEPIQSEEPNNAIFSEHFGIPTKSTSSGCTSITEVG